jgi:phage terminase large subunit
VRAQIPEKLGFLFKPARYKVVYGGRGGSKSWGVARTLLIQGVARPLRVLCAREFQQSIAQSVHKLLSDQIKALGLESFYEIQQSTIKGPNGTEFFFAGLAHNVTGLKSYEGVDICWVEEGQAVSKSSWEILIPTIRKEGSEIWTTFNPELEEDETYQRFVLNPPTGAVVVRMNWSDNPWFPAVLHQEMEDLKRRDPDAWLNVWEGHCRTALEGAVYAKELRAATEDDRICRVPHLPSLPVHRAWDLGHYDSTAIWMVQRVGFEYHVIDYLEGRQQKLTDYLTQLQNKPYLWGVDFVPHDATHQSLTGKSVEQVLKDMGLKVVVVPRANPAIGIDATRTMFPTMWFDADKCADGLQALRHYRYDLDEHSGRLSREPLHDWSSHGADALRTFAVGFTADAVRERVETQARRVYTVGSDSTADAAWMGA